MPCSLDLSDTSLMIRLWIWDFGKTNKNESVILFFSCVRFAEFIKSVGRCASLIWVGAILTEEAPHQFQALPRLSHATVAARGAFETNLHLEPSCSEPHLDGVIPGGPADAQARVRDHGFHPPGVRCALLLAIASWCRERISWLLLPPCLVQS